MTTTGGFRVVSLGLGLWLGLTASARADDRPATAPDLSGTWKWEWKDGQGVTHKHILEVEGQAPKFVARERFDQLEPVKVTDLKVEDKKIRFSVRRGDRYSVYSGTLADPNTINGKVTVSAGDNQASEFGWTATREPVKPKSTR